jgi:hypothetical protein
MGTRWVLGGGVMFGEDLSWIASFEPPILATLSVSITMRQVYWDNGCQIIPPLDSGIAAAIEANLDLWDLSKVDLAVAARSGLLTDPLPAVTAAYFQRLKEQVHFCGAKENGASEPVVYTPLVRFAAVGCSGFGVGFVLPVVLLARLLI